MNVGELRVYFKDNLNRDDLTDDLADTFIGMGLRRVERRLRTPFQRASVEATVVLPWDGYVVIPADYLSIISVKVNGRTIHRTSETGGPSESTVGCPALFWFERERLFFGPDLKEGDVIVMHYYAEMAESESDIAPTEASLIIPDVIVYSALVYAAIHFVDERKATFEDMFEKLLQEVKDMISADEMSGGLAIRSPLEGYY